MPDNAKASTELHRLLYIPAVAAAAAVVCCVLLLHSYVNVISVSFAKPDCTYVKGSLALANTGLQFSSTGQVVQAAIAALKAAQPNTRVMLAVGGATYGNFAGMNTACIKDLVDDFGFDGGWARGRGGGTGLPLAA
jgi:hypothetical protein